MPAVAVVQYLANKTSQRDQTYRQILVALANVFHGDGRNPIEPSVRSVIDCEKEVHGLTEEQILQAVRVVFQPLIPIIYPDQFAPICIIAPDGQILWRKPAV